jgi:hypothetical protein
MTNSLVAVSGGAGGTDPSAAANYKEDFKILQSERWEDNEEVHRVTFERGRSRIWTALPVVVLSDSDGFVVEVQPTIQGMATDPQTGVQTNVNMPSLGKHVPVHFPSGGGFTFTHPIKKGDEGIVVFSSRCIDGWWQQGGIQPQLEQRYHNLSDAMYIPGIRSTPRALNPPASTESSQLRSDDGTTYVEIAGGGVVNIVVPSSGHVQVTGDLRVTGKVYAGYGGSDQVQVQTHTHNGVQSGSDDTGSPVAGT